MTIFSTKRMFFTYISSKDVAFLVNRTQQRQPLTKGLHMYNPFVDSIVRIKPSYTVDRHFKLNNQEAIQVTVSLQTTDSASAVPIVQNDFKSVENIVEYNVVKHPMLSDKFKRSDQDVVSFTNALRKDCEEASTFWGMQVSSLFASVKDYRTQNELNFDKATS